MRLLTNFEGEDDPPVPDLDACLDPTLKNYEQPASLRFDGFTWRRNAGSMRTPFGVHMSKSSGGYSSRNSLLNWAFVDFSEVRPPDKKCCVKSRDLAVVFLGQQPGRMAIATGSSLPPLAEPFAAAGSR